MEDTFYLLPQSFGVFYIKCKTPLRYIIKI
jgi:hypothetical protein